jgi:hypothetical protein
MSSRFASFENPRLARRIIMKIIHLRNSNGKNIAFIQMQHIATKKFHEKIYSLVEDFKQNNYFHFYEGCKGTKEESQKLLGMRIINTPPKFRLYDFLASVDQELSSEKSFRGTKGARNVDLPMGEILKYKKYCPEKIRDIDFNSIQKFFEYRASKFVFKFVLKYLIKYIGRKNTKRSYLLFPRDRYLAKETLQSRHKKILITYGAAHFDGFFKELRLYDSSWRVVKSEKI